MRYALNIGDATKLDSIILDFAIRPVIQSKLIIRAEKTIDGGAVVLDCSEEQSEALVWLVRRKYHRNEVRMYQGSDKLKGWKRI